MWLRPGYYQKTALSALTFRRFRTPRAGHEEILPAQLALFHHRQTVLAAPQIVRAAVVRAKREFATRVLRHANERRAGQPVAVIQFDGYTMTRRGLRHPAHTLRSPQL